MYLNEKELKEYFVNHLMKQSCFEKEEVDFLLLDFLNPYKNTYLREEFILETEIDNVLWEKRACIVDFSCLGVKKPICKYYTYYNRSKMNDLTVQSYLETEKKYQITKIKKSDFEF